MTSVLIVDDHGLLADGLALALTAEGLPAAVHVPTSSQGILEAVAGGRPEVVLLDLELGLGRGTGVELVFPLVTMGAKVLVLTGSTSRLAHAACLEAGAAAVVSKG
ncbi:MAG: response regulator, partial [Actinomycetota bacterium]|nr:response regulator [Actinomycetota bacterium]